MSEGWGVGVASFVVIRIRGGGGGWLTDAGVEGKFEGVEEGCFDAVEGAGVAQVEECRGGDIAGLG